jgi:hypothetical protein
MLGLSTSSVGGSLRRPKIGTFESLCYRGLRLALFSAADLNEKLGFCGPGMDLVFAALVIDRPPGLR